MKNEYEVRGNVTAVLINSEKYGNFETLIDTTDLNLLHDFPNFWKLLKDNKSDSFYIVGKIYQNSKSKSILLHRYITDAPKGMVVDHINHNTLDNRRSNLRIVPHHINILNRRERAKNNRTSGFLGVSWNSRKVKWCSNITINGKYKHLGYFEELNEAVEVSRLARENVLSQYN